MSEQAKIQAELMRVKVTPRTEDENAKFDLHLQVDAFDPSRIQDTLAIIGIESLTQAVLQLEPEIDVDLTDYIHTDTTDKTLRHTVLLTEVIFT